MGTDQGGGRQFLEELERHHEPTLAVIRGHPFVTSVAEGLCLLNDLSSPRQLPSATTIGRLGT